MRRQREIIQVAAQGPCPAPLPTCCAVLLRWTALLLRRALLWCAAVLLRAPWQMLPGCRSSDSSSSSSLGMLLGCDPAVISCDIII